MAIYSIHLRSVGRTTHRAGTAGAHVKYITRPEAASRVIGAHMPTDRAGAQAWLDQQEQADRANARVVDKLRIALPRELDAEQCAQLVRDVCQDMTQGRCAWMAAIHDQGKDAANPHAHVILRDRDIDTGKRVMRMSDNARDRQKAGLEPSACEWVRERWEHHANAALERAGCQERIDRRTLEVQKIDREPQIHVGPAVLAMAEKGERPQSQPREVATRDGSSRTVDYPSIDQGRTRQERNAEIIQLAQEREQRAQAEKERQAAKAEQDAQEARELELYRQALAQQAEREQRQQAERHAQECEKLDRDQSARAAIEQQRNARADQQRAELDAKAAKANQAPSDLLGRLLDKAMPARVQEREQAEQRRQAAARAEAKAEQARREQRQREREERERREREELARRQERERQEQARGQAERIAAKVQEFQRQQERIREQRSRIRIIELRTRSQDRDGFGRERERERPGRGDRGGPGF